jgi:hypothetical protein
MREGVIALRLIKFLGHDRARAFPGRGNPNQPLVRAEEAAAALDATDKDVSIGGAGLAAAAVELGLVDELRIFRNPVVIGGGTPFLPPVTEDLPLDLIDTRTFGSRVIYERCGASAMTRTDTSKGAHPIRRRLPQADPLAGPVRGASATCRHADRQPCLFLSKRAVVPLTVICQMQRRGG